jgi:hypothetical protein
MSKLIFAAMQIAEHVAAGNFTDRIELGGAMSLPSSEIARRDAGRPECPRAGGSWP